MHVKTLIGCAILTPILFAGPVLGQEADGKTIANTRTELLAFNLPGVEIGRQSAANRPVELAQAAEPQINDLQEQIRRLNGKVEELNFQIIQMQDQMRKQQQDNEYRLEQLEKKRTDAGAETATDVARAAAPDGKSAGRDMVGQDVKSIIDEPDNGSGKAADAGPDGETLGAPPKTFGTIKFDAKGNPVGGTVAPDAASPESSAAGGQGGTMMASLPATDDPEELYHNSYQLILSGDYKAAEAGFREHIKRFPRDPRAADAHFWLGEALLGQDRYRDAAQVFLDANKAYPKSKKAPDMLLKLGISLSAMNQREIACGTYHSIGERYPHASEALKDRVKQEEALAGC
jgi:tol-pal system protein YbgF